MKSFGASPARIPNPTSLHKLLIKEFSNSKQAIDLFDEFLKHSDYNHSFCVRLFAIARLKSATWSIRRLAIMMLEHQVLKLDPDNLAEFDFLFDKLSLKKAPGLAEPIVKSVIKEGYSTTEMRGFIVEFRRKLKRLDYLHDNVCGKKTSVKALSDFIGLSRRECKLSLARYLFTPEEVVDEILRQMYITEGVKDVDASSSRPVEGGMTRIINALPDFEGSILKRLCETGEIYWVSDATSSAVNSLVEYPLTTVVLTIKPPGSDIEFEIKRAGRKGPNALNIVHSRDGKGVPPSHRLDGGNMLWLLQYEAIAASRLKGIYRLVHGTEAPMTQYISRATINSVPAHGTSIQTILFFSDPQWFGPGFREMRTAMKKSIDAFRGEGNDMLPDMPGDLGLTAQFLGHVAPAQSILCGTSSFRLDKLARYLSTNGPETYFREGLGVTFSKQDEMRLADELLEEVLGVYHPPKVSYKTYDQYVTDALCVEMNREQADRVYLSLMTQIAKFWGTLLAIRGYSRGESFVARNVGLKSYWGDGQWRVKIIFMDHDGLAIPGPQDEKFYAKGGIPNMTYDELYLWGKLTPKQFARSAVGCLQSIYKIGKKCDAQGQALTRTALKEAYRKTQDALLTNPKLQSVFHKGFLSRLLDWDKLVAGSFRMNGNSSANRQWKKEMKEMLAAKGYGNEAFESYLETIKENRAFLERNRDLFDS